MTAVEDVRDAVAVHVGPNLRFRVTVDGKEHDLEVRLVVKPQVYPQARAGENAFGDGLVGSGTLGWNLVLDGAVVALSNWHVFCPNGNDTQLGLDVFLDGAHEADLSVFQPVRRLGNTWDYALATYTNPALALAQMRGCDDDAGTVHPYPMALSDPRSVTVGDGKKYRKVGDRSPLCRTGTLDGVGSFWVDYGAHGQSAFDNQLIFSKMSDPGDSGSVIVRLSDNTVTGLNFAGDDHETDANPLFRAGWSFLGTRRLIKGGPDIPEFRSYPSGLCTDLPVALARPDLATPSLATWVLGKSATSLRSRERRESSFFAISNPQGIPNFTSGKSILTTVARQQDVPAETTEVIDLENGLLLCLGDRMRHGWGIRQAQKTAPPFGRTPLPRILAGKPT